MKAQLAAAKYDLVANICHDSSGAQVCNGWAIVYHILIDIFNENVVDNRREYIPACVYFMAIISIMIDNDVTERLATLWIAGL